MGFPDFAVHLVTLPVIRNAGDARARRRPGFSTFFFLAAMAGWGSVWLGDGQTGLIRQTDQTGALGACATWCSARPAWQLAQDPSL